MWPNNNLTISPADVPMRTLGLLCALQHCRGKHGWYRSLGGSGACNRSNLGSVAA